MKQQQLLQSGKVKSVYKTDTPGRLIIEFRDDITAFDGGKKDVLMDKGQPKTGSNVRNDETDEDNE